MMRRRIVPDHRTRTCRLRLPAEERKLLAMLPAELAAVLEKLDPSADPPDSLRLLFPHAYVSDEKAERAYSESTRAELASTRLSALQALSETADESVLTEEQMGEWMGALTSLRLVLGSILKVSDEHPLEVPAGRETGSDAVVYNYLTLLQSELVDVMEQWLPDPVPGADDSAPEDPWGDPLGGLRWDGTPQPEWPPGAPSEWPPDGPPDRPSSW